MVSLKRLNSQRELVTNIRKRESKFFEHVMGRRKLEYVITIGREEQEKTKKVDAKQFGIMTWRKICIGNYLLHTGCGQA